MLIIIIVIDSWVLTTSSMRLESSVVI